MIVHNFDPVLVDLGFFQIRWYSISYILGILLGWIYAKKIIRKIHSSHNELSIKNKIFEDFPITLIVVKTPCEFQRSLNLISFRSL